MFSPTPPSGDEILLKYLLNGTQNLDRHGHVVPANSYALDFFKHGSWQSVTKDNNVSAVG